MSEIGNQKPPDDNETNLKGILDSVIEAMALPAAPWGILGVGALFVVVATFAGLQVQPLFGAVLVLLAAVSNIIAVGVVTKRIDKEDEVKARGALETALEDCACGGKAMMTYYKDADAFAVKCTECGRHSAFEYQLEDAVRAFNSMAETQRYREKRVRERDLAQSLRQAIDLATEMAGETAAKETTRGEGDAGTPE